MRLAPGVEALELRRDPSDPARTIYPVVLWDEAGGTDAADGPTLVDTGAPGQIELLTAELRRVGLEVAAVRRVILTHEDPDHVGGLAEVVRASGARVFAHPEAAPYIQGDRPPLRGSGPGHGAAVGAAGHPAAPGVLARVDAELRDGEVLPWHGGIRVVHTPGHTPGHVSLFLQAHGLLIAGDALRADGGVLLGAKPELSIDHGAAERSVVKLAALPVRIERIHCHHGGLCHAGAAEQLRELAGAIAGGTTGG